MPFHHSVSLFLKEDGLLSGKDSLALAAGMKATRPPRMKAGVEGSDGSCVEGMLQATPLGTLRLARVAWRRRHPTRREISYILEPQAASTT
jgi:hypothetical protein